MPLFDPLSHAGATKTSTFSDFFQQGAAHSPSPQTPSSTPQGETSDSFMGVEYPSHALDNPLDGYIDVVTNMRFSMVTCPAGGDRGGASTTENLKELKYVVFASTSGDCDIDHTLGIQKFQMKTVQGVDAANAEHTDVVEASMQLAEPYGISLDRIIREQAGKLGYTTNTTNIIWRLDLWWSGYDGATGRWEEQIKFTEPRRRADTVGQITYFFVITKAVGSLQQGINMEWSLVMVPVANLGLRSENQAIPAGSLNDIKTFGDFVDRFQAWLNSNKSGTRPPIDYEIVIDDDISTKLRGSQFRAGALTDKTNAIFRESEKGTDYTIADNSTVSGVIRCALDVAVVVQDDMFVDDEEQVDPRYVYLVRTDVLYGAGNVDPKTQEYKNTKIKWTIERFEDFRRVSKDRAKQVDPGLRVRRINKIIELDLLRRVYNYALTSENSEVMDFKVELKFLYYLPLPDIAGTEQAGPRKVGGVGDSVSEVERQRGQSIDHSNTSPPTGGKDAFKDGWPVRKRVVRDPTKTGGTKKGDDDPKTTAYNAEFQARLTNDMVLMDGMQVRGDPRWLLSRDSGPSIGIGCNVIRVNVFVGDQEKYFDPAAWPLTEQNVGGFFDVYKIDTTVDSSGFQQRLTGYKLQNLSS